MLNEVQVSSAPQRQTYLLDRDEPRAPANGHQAKKPDAKLSGYELACFEELGRIQSCLDELGVLLREVHQTVATKPTVKQSYSTHDVARILGKRPFTVREWCRHGRVHAKRALCGRGIDKEWRISHEELERIQNEGLLPVRKRF